MEVTLPEIVESRVSLIETLVIPDLFIKPGDLRAEFSFLGSSDLYSEYYMDFERPSKPPTKFAAPVAVPGLGPLLPLRRKHARNSYWKAFRLTIEASKRQGADLQQLFLLLPLRAEIPVGPMAVNKLSLPAQAFIYLFPFGACCVNLDVLIQHQSFYDFIDIARKLSGTNVMRHQDAGDDVNEGTFTNFARTVSKKIVSALFGEERGFSEFPPHKFLGVKETSPALSDFSNPHRRAIAASMSGRTLEDVSSDLDASANAVLQGKWKVLRPGEMRFLSTRSSFIYPSPDWTAKPQQAVNQGASALKDSALRRKRGCMLGNYQSFLNEVFAVNRLVKVVLPQMSRAPQKRVEDLKKCIELAFPKDDTSTYFREPLKVLKGLIAFDESMRGL